VAGLGGDLDAAAEAASVAITTTWAVNIKAGFIAPA
jgi:hypothetical protein